MEKTLAPKIISRTALTNARPGFLLMEAIQDDGGLIIDYMPKGETRRSTRVVFAFNESGMWEVEK